MFLLKVQFCKKVHSSCRQRILNRWGADAFPVSHWMKKHISVTRRRTGKYHSSESSNIGEDVLRRDGRSRGPGERDWQAAGRRAARGRLCPLRHCTVGRRGERLGEVSVTDILWKKCSSSTPTLTLDWCRRACSRRSPAPGEQVSAFPGRGTYRL